MQRRSFLRSMALGGATAFAARPASAPAASAGPMKISRVRFYRNPASPLHFNQSFHLVTVETDAGIDSAAGDEGDVVTQDEPVQDSQPDKRAQKRKERNQKAAGRKRS